jgi:hypothetical protein
MKRLLIGLAVLPFAAGVAGAAQPLTNQQMDRVTAGFSAQSIADATGLVGESGVILTNTQSVSEVGAFRAVNLGEITATAYKSYSGASSSSVGTSFAAIPLN